MKVIIELDEDEAKTLLMGKSALRALTEIRSALQIRKVSKETEPEGQQPDPFTIDDLTEIVLHHGIDINLITSEPY